VAPKKAALKEAEAELAVAMEVSVFTLSLSGFHSLPDLLLRRFPHNSIGVEEGARFESCPKFTAKGGKGNEKKTIASLQAFPFPHSSRDSLALVRRNPPFNACHAGYKFIFRVLERVTNFETNMCAVISLLCHVIFAKSVILSVQKFGFGLIRRELAQIAS